MRFETDNGNSRLNFSFTSKASAVFQINLLVIFEEAFKQALSTEDKLKLEAVSGWLNWLQLTNKNQSKLTCNRTVKGQQKSFDAVTFQRCGNVVYLHSRWYVGALLSSQIDHNEALVDL